MPPVLYPYAPIHIALKCLPLALFAYRPIRSSLLAKGRMHGQPHSLALARQRVSGQGVKSNHRYYISCNNICQCCTFVMIRL